MRGGSLCRPLGEFFFPQRSSVQSRLLHQEQSGRPTSGALAFWIGNRPADGSASRRRTWTSGPAVEARRKPRDFPLTQKAGCARNCRPVSIWPKRRTEGGARSGRGASSIFSPPFGLCSVLRTAQQNDFFPYFL